jgi:hypothetical protein
VLKVAVPLLRLWVPSVAEPSRKVTLPVAPAGATVAVRLTAWPTADVVGDADSDVVVGVRIGVVLTVTVTGDELLPRTLASPL